jgi:hypothetical protein
MASSRRPKKKPVVSQRQVRAFMDRLFGEDMHAARVGSLANGVTGVLEAGQLGIHAIGRGLAAVQGLTDKHATKQVDRLIGNEKLDPVALSEAWTRLTLAEQEGFVFVNLDWTEFDADDQSMLVASLQGSGRAVPLLWTTARKSRLKGRRNGIEDALVERLAACRPAGLRVVLVADRGFCDQALFTTLAEEHDLDFIIRIRKEVHVTDAKGTTRPAGDWVSPTGRMRTLKGARVTTDKTLVGAVVAVKDKGMKEPWLLAVSTQELTGSEAKRRYGSRFTCEESFRDIKDLRYGLGMSWTRVTQPLRRDRMMLMATLAHALLMELGAAGEDAGLDRLLKTNTSKKRTLSLFRQGLRWYQLLPNMPTARLRKLMKAFDARVRRHPVFSVLVGVVGE